ncbi:hypothetical protein LZ906_016070 (plasmid) [Paraclostridium ghonii]|uniref:hypothetical protein n=1 Tax=Paraclostridium ghonii TaxID=29358 RepID=UPI00202CDED3|nr:hypothetical protein [Paeniclostridium ghonii]MCM0165108.1 hypothetical protein [Paeniclostridium ghonii]
MLSDKNPQYKSKYSKFIILLIIFQLLIEDISQYFATQDSVRFYFDIENIISTFLLGILYFIDVTQQRKFNMQNNNLIQKDCTKGRFSFSILIDIFILIALIYNVYRVFNIFV